MEIKTCKRCGEPWCFHGTGRPIRCGKCKTPYWDREAKVAVEGVKGVLGEKVEAGSTEGVHPSKGGAVDVGKSVRKHVLRKLVPTDAAPTSPLRTVDGPCNIAGHSGCPECGSVSGHQKWCSKR